MLEHITSRVTLSHVTHTAGTCLHWGHGAFAHPAIALMGRWGKMFYPNLIFHPVQYFQVHAQLKERKESTETQKPSK